MTGPAMSREEIAAPELTAEQVRALLEAMGKRQSLLRTIAGAPRPRAAWKSAPPRAGRLPGRTAWPAGISRPQMAASAR